MDLTLAVRSTSSTNFFRRYSWLLLMTAVGVFLGTKTLVMLPLWVLNLSLAIMILVFVGSNLFHLNYQVSPRLEGILSPIAGFVGGFLNGMTNVGAPATAVYLDQLVVMRISSLHPTGGWDSKKVSNGSETTSWSR